MEWLSRFNEAIRYIEAHLTDEINISKVAGIACCSTFHFQRMFSYIADISLSEYIRRRKMTLAAFDLQNSDMKVLDIAIKYGYESPTAFNRAFQGIHGVPPSKAKDKGISLKAFPPISFKLTIKGDTEMNYKIENKEAFKIVGVKRSYPMSVEQSFEEVPKFWAEVARGDTVPKLCTLMDKAPYGVLGLSTCMSGESFDYYIAVATDKTAPDEFEEYTVPPCTWAIFECVGAMPYSIQNLQKRIVTEWLPSSGYEYANAPDIEVYFEGDQSSPDYKCEVWLPIVKVK